MSKQKNIDTPDHIRSEGQSAQYFKKKFGEKAIESVKEIMKINALVFGLDDAHTNGMPPNCSYEYWHSVQTILEQDAKNAVTPIVLMTNEDTKRVKSEWERISGESVDVELVSQTFYGFCSELASLRLLKKYRKNKNADCGYSKNLETFYFRLETE